MTKANVFKSFNSKAILILLAINIFYFENCYADSGNIDQIQSFIKNIITAFAGLSGLIATGFFVVGGFRYITSSGNPINLDKAKRTILYSATGLAITIGAFVLSNIIGGIAKGAFGG
ncbi:MAG TPA: TrbC/VirB2 family protein [Patescibacteria group bacterium]|nr:TrbC/VirB2 family protein [Patescibacteria group bacterium]